MTTKTKTPPAPMNGRWLEMGTTLCIDSHKFLDDDGKIYSISKADNNQVISTNHPIYLAELKVWIGYFRPGKPEEPETKTFWGFVITCKDNKRVKTLSYRDTKLSASKAKRSYELDGDYICGKITKIKLPV